MDAQRTRNMAQYLLQTSLPFPQAPSETGYGENFEGFASTPQKPLPAKAPTPVDAPSPHVTRIPNHHELLQPPPIPHPPKKAAEELLSLKQPIPKGAFLSRLRQFSDILQRELNVYGVFLVGDSAEILLDEINSPPLIKHAHNVSKTSFVQLKKSPDKPLPHSSFPLNNKNAFLEVIPVNTLYGPLVLGIVTPKAFSTPLIEKVATFLKKTIQQH